MATIISNGNTTLNTASGFYAVESANLSPMSTTLLALTTTRYINVTFDHAGNSLGIVLNLITTSMTSKSVISSLEWYQSVTSFNTTTERVNKVAHTLLDNDIVSFTTTGVLPTGITAGVQYYVINRTADDFQISTSLGGSAVGLSGTPSGTWAVGVERATKTLTTTEIAGDGMSGTYKYRDGYFTPFIFTSGYAVDTDAGEWRFRIGHGSGTGTWQLGSSDGTNPFYAAWCDNAATFADTNVVIVKDTVTIDKTATFGAVLGTGDAVNGTSCVICSNPANPTAASVAQLVWENPPVSAYTLSIGGKVYIYAYSGFRVGSENRTLTPVTITIANPGVVTSAGHGLTNGQAVVFSTTGALPTGITAGTRYFVANKTDDTFEFEATVGGGSIETTGTQSGVHTCLHRLRIPLAQKATITFTAPAAGTATSGLINPTGAGSYTYGGLSSLFLYGEIPTYQKTTLASDAATGQKDLVCTDNVDWVNGDSIVVGKQNIMGQGDTTIYTVDSVAGDTVTTTANIATNIRRAGGTVLKLGGHGILMQNNSTFSQHYLCATANLQISGVELYNQIIYTISGTGYYSYLQSLQAAYRSQWLIQDVVTWSNTTSCLYAFGALVPPDGVLEQRVYSFRQNVCTNNVAYYNTTHTSGRMTVKDCVVLCHYWGTMATSTSIRMTVDNNSFENSRSGAGVPYFYMTGINGVFTNNKVWGSGNAEPTGGAVAVGACVAPLDISGNYYDYNACAVGMSSHSSVGCVDNNSIFGSEYANTTDVGFVAGGYHDYIFNSDTGNLVISELYLGDMVEGGKVGFTDFNDTTNDDRVYFRLGKTQRTGDSLTDTTVHTAGTGKFAIRFEPLSSTENLAWEISVPTGDITAKTMFVSVWCKINNATYWAGTKEMPRLTVNYDNGTSVYTEAAESTDWQLLVRSFTPTTAYGQITVSLSARTDAVTTNAYVYWDDFSVAYPPNASLDLGGMDLWTKGLPITPPIAIPLSAGTVASSVWEEAKTSHVTAGTMGEAMTFMKKVIGWLRSLL